MNMKGCTRVYSIGGGIGMVYTELTKMTYSHSGRESQWGGIISGAPAYSWDAWEPRVQIQADKPVSSSSGCSQMNASQPQAASAIAGIGPGR